MEHCVFCKIARNELPSYKVYEDENFLAFLDIHPYTPGHVQIVPKTHYRWVWDLPEELEARYFLVVQKIAKAIQKAFETDLVMSKIMGEEIPHAHIWVFPHKDVKGELKDFDGNMEKIKNALL